MCGLCEVWLLNNENISKVTFLIRLLYLRVIPFKGITLRSYTPLRMSPSDHGISLSHSVRVF